MDNTDLKKKILPSIRYSIEIPRKKKQSIVLANARVAR